MNILTRVVHRAVYERFQEQFPMALAGLRLLRLTTSLIPYWGQLSKQDRQYFIFKPPCLYCAFMLLLFTFSFCIVGLSRTWLLLYIPVSFFQPVFLLLLRTLNLTDFSDKKEAAFCGLRGSLSQVHFVSAF